MKEREKFKLMIKTNLASEKLTKNLHLKGKVKKTRQIFF